MNEWNCRASGKTFGVPDILNLSCRALSCKSIHSVFHLPYRCSVLLPVKFSNCRPCPLQLLPTLSSPGCYATGSLFAPRSTLIIRNSGHTDSAVRSRPVCEGAFTKISMAIGQDRVEHFQCRLKGFYFSRTLEKCNPSGNAGSGLL